MANDGILLGLALFLGIGFITGLRSMTGPAVIAWAVYLGWLHPAGALAFVGHTWAVALFTLLAIGELIADKLPTTPNRTGAIGLGGRSILWGGIGGGDSPEPMVGNGDHGDHGCDRSICWIPRSPLSDEGSRAAGFSRCGSRGPLYDCGWDLYGQKGSVTS